VLSELWGDAARRLQDDVAAQPSRQGRLRVLAAGVADRLPQSGDGDLLVRRAAQELMSGVSLTDTGRFVGVGERHLRRRFERAIGYGPATLVRIQRFQQFLGLADRHPGAAITRLAAEAGYADQAHLSRECRRLSELSPADLLAERPIAAGDKSVSFNTEPTEPATLAS
jgi:transcriptional regulator GlxA family with amidase domain